jgi:hypothetical protein
LLGELSAVVGDAGFRDHKMENDVLDEIYYLPGANLSQGPHLDPLIELVNHDEQVGQVPGKGQCNGDGLENLS